MNRKNFCKDCGYSNFYHLYTWLEEIICRLPPIPKLPKRIEDFFDAFLTAVFTFLKIATWRTDFTSQDVQLRSFCFAEELKKRGAVCYVLKTVFGFTNHFRVYIGKKVVHFEMLPGAGFKSKYTNRIVDDKQLTKEFCKNSNFPVAEGQSFWFWQKQKAMQLAEELGFPLVVKPRGGSQSRHVTTHIESSAQLERAIQKAVAYSPVFLVEKFLPNTFVYRATVVDFDFVVCVQQMSAHIVGNGVSPIRELIDKKNSDPQRGEICQKQFMLYKITEDETTKGLLGEKGYNEKTILKNGETLLLQRNPFLKLGGDLLEVTPFVHADNKKLFSVLARFFDIRLTGIDFLCHDIAVSWKNQPCAVLELNSAPCIELHHFPSSGTPTNPAKALADMFFKYYV